MTDDLRASATHPSRHRTPETEAASPQTAPRQTAPREIAQGAPGGLDCGVVARITRAVLAQERGEAEVLLRGVLETGVTAETIVDAYIPVVARRFGESWCEDGHSFAEVTMAVARLQSWLRELLPDEDPFAAFRLDAPEVLLVVPEGSHHTLGAMVAMAQFRRRGAAVQLSLGEAPEDIGERVRTQRFDMVAISAAGSEKLEFLRMVINNVRTGLAPAPLVVLGGPILDEVVDVGDRVGADAATSDPGEALELCGPTLSTSAVAQERVQTQPRRALPQHRASVP